MKAIIEIGAAAPEELEAEFNTLEEVSAAMQADPRFSNPVIADGKIIFESKISDEEGSVFGFCTLA